MDRGHGDSRRDRDGRSCTHAAFLNAVTFLRHNQTMNNGYDCLAEAEAAMKKAAASTCPSERLKWVRIAQAWQDLSSAKRG